MDPLRWGKIEKIFNMAVELAGTEREELLARECAGDAALREQVERLIGRDEADEDFLKAPVLGDPLVADDLRDKVISFIEDDLAPPQPESNMIGRRVGAYRLTREIDKGGMGIVYEAERADGEFSQRVAIKLIKRGMDTDFIIRRFRHERQILASLNHPNIARLIDGGTLDGSPYFVMEFIEGEPLLGFCERHELGLEERLGKFLDVCRAISYAHEKKVIHRDIKPGNLLVDSGGTPKLLDFGIAKILDPDLVHESISPTATAMRMMTPEYASPEQARGDRITPASDQYSLGALLYELTTGARPYKFTSRAPHEVARVICEERPALPLLATPRTGNNSARRNLLKNSSLGPALETVIMRALEKQPGERYGSVEEFAADIERILQGRTVRGISPETAFKPPHQTGDADNQAADTGRSLAPVTGEIKAASGISPRGRGVRQGLFIVIGAVLSLPVLLIIAITGTLDPALLLGVFVIGVGAGLMRAIYALFFEPGAGQPGLPAEPPVRAAASGNASLPSPDPVDALRATRGAKPAVPDERSLAVLPFKSLQAAGDDTAFLSFGLADALVMRLSSVRDFIVRPGSSAQRVARNTADSFLAGEELEVRYLLEGNFVRSDGRIRVSVQLLDITKRSTVWAERFEESADDVLALVDIISRKVAEMLVPHISGGELSKLAAGGTRSAEAHEAYLHGRFHWNTFTGEGFRQAKVYYERAIALDPNYALAYAGLTDYYLWLGAYALVPPNECYPQAREAAERAVALDPRSAEAHSALGFARLCAYDWAGAASSAERAISLNPNYANTYIWYTTYFFAQEKWEEGFRAINRAIKLDPFSYQAHNSLAYGLYFARRYDEAIAKTHNNIERFPGFSLPYIGLAVCLRKTGRTEEALAASDRAVELSSDLDRVIALFSRASSLGAAGRKDEALAQIREIEVTAGERYIAPREYVITYCWLGDKEKALDALERSLEEGENLIWTKAEPSLDILRDDPRYIEVVEKIERLLDASIPASSAPAAERLPETEKPASTAIAVLPFKMLNMRETLETGEEEFLRIGLADAVTTRLSNVKQLIVRPTSSVRRYDAADVDSFTAGENLNVEFLIEGTIMKLNDRLRVTIQLLDVARRSAVWAKRYDNELGDLLAFEDQLSMLLAESLVPQLTGEERRQLEKRGTENIEAFEAYLHGRFYWDSLTDEGLQKAIVYFNRAIELDPGYAQAHAAIADYYVMFGVYNVLPIGDFYPPARAAAERAVEIDPTLSEAYTALALATLYGEYEWERSAAYFARAIELNPNNSFAHLWSSHCDYSRNRFREGDRAIRRALEIDPQSFQNLNTYAWSSYFSGDAETAVARMDEAIRLFPSNSHGYMGKGCFLNYLGRTEEALEAMEQSNSLSKGSLYSIYGLAQAYAGAGRRDEALRLIEKTRDGSPKEYYSLFQIALVYCYLGEVDEAFGYLERSIKAHESLLVWIAIEPSFDIIRGDERYNKLLRKIGHPLGK